MQGSRLVRPLSACGLVGSILFFFLLSIARLSRPGYTMFAWYISDLGTGPNGWIQDTNFILVGLLMVGFILALHLTVSDGKGSKIGPVLLGLAGLAMAGLGVFTSCPNWCSSGTIHVFLFFTSMGGLIAGITVFSRRLSRDSQWRSYARYTFWTGIVSLIALLTFMLGTMADPATLAPTGLLGPWVGLHQIVIAGLPLLWVGVMSLKLLRVTRSMG